MCCFPTSTSITIHNNWSCRFALLDLQCTYWYSVCTGLVLVSKTLHTILLIFLCCTDDEACTKCTSLCIQCHVVYIALVYTTVTLNGVFLLSQIHTQFLRCDEYMRMHFLTESTATSSIHTQTLTALVLVNMKWYHVAYLSQRLGKERATGRAGNGSRNGNKDGSEVSEKTCGKMLTKADDFTLRAGTSAQESISESLQVSSSQEPSRAHISIVGMRMGT